MTYASTRRACANCGCELFPKKNGVQVVHKGLVYEADLWECPDCATQVISGFAGNGTPVEEASPPPVQYPRLGIEGELADKVEDRAICLQCRQMMEVAIEEVAVLEMATFGPYKLWLHCKVLVCAHCGFGVVKPSSYKVNAEAHHWQKDFVDKLARARKHLEVLEVR